MHESLQPAIDGGALSRRRPRRRGDLSTMQLSAFLNLPSILLIIAVVGYPLLYAAWVSFHHVGIRELRTGQAAWAGLGNYAAALADPAFRSSFVHTVVFTAISVALEIGLGLGVALAMNMKGIWLARGTAVVMLVPWAIPPIVNGILWSFIFNSEYGYLNDILLRLHLTTSYVSFLTNSTLAFAVVIIAYVWRTTPFSALLFHASLQGIPHDLYEAADVDGASAVKRLFGITLPLLTPTFLAVLVLRTLFAFLVFDEILAITYGGPGNSTWTAAWYVYASAFFYLKFGLGSAAAYLLSVATGLVALLYIRLLSRRAEYA